MRTVTYLFHVAALTAGLAAGRGLYQVVSCHQGTIQQLTIAGDKDGR